MPSDSNPLSLGAHPHRTPYEYSRSVIPNNYATVGEAAQILGRTPGRVRAIFAKDTRQLMTPILKTSEAPRIRGPTLQAPTEHDVTMTD